MGNVDGQVLQGPRLYAPRPPSFVLVCNMQNLQYSRATADKIII